MTSFHDVMALAAEADGWMTEAQGHRLYDAAARCRPGGRIVEIGSFRGRSTIVLAAAAADGVEVVAIDPHAGNDRGPNELEGFGAEAATDREVFRANLERAGVAGRVRHVAAFSRHAHGDVGDPIDVLYVDGAHRYGPARADLRDWGARVMDGGTLLVHDAFSSVGVTTAIGRQLVLSDRFRYVGRSGSLVEYRADRRGSGVGRVRNAAVQLAQLGWFARNVALKVALTLGYGRVARRLGRPVPEWPY
jgi:predicted O-methyltransferase YrrM